ncbi:hypothetical protein DIPPA_21834 [Diplonema papillatum]|nr:hypothetical protein DIPPA_21834 [Diplonema papillatum]
MAHESPTDFGSIEPWIWTASSACAFVCFIVIPDRLRESQFAYASLTAMTINCHYAIWSIQVSEWVYLVADAALSFYYDIPPPSITGAITYVVSVAVMLYVIWKLHAQDELEMRRLHAYKKSDEYRRDVPLIPSWGLMTLWMLSFCLLFHWVGGLNILMYQVYPCAVGIGIMLMIFVP